MRYFNKLLLHLHSCVMVSIYALMYLSVVFILSHNLVLVFVMLSSLLQLHVRVESMLNGKTLRFLIMQMMKMGIVKSIHEGVSRIL